MPSAPPPGGAPGPGGTTSPAGGALAIVALEEPSAPVDAPIRIVGQGFGASRGSSTVTVGGAAVTDVIAWSDAEIAIRIPAGAGSGEVVVTTAAGVARAAFSLATGRAHFVAPGGDDAAAGTIAAPLATIRSAVDRARPGDWVVLRAGTWNERVRTATDGGATDATRITIAGFPGELIRVAVSGRALDVSHDGITVKDIELDGGFGSSDAVRTSNADRMILRGLTVKNAGSSSATAGGGDGIDVEGGTDILIADCEIFDCLAGDLANQRDSHGIVAGAFRRLTIRGCRIYRCSGDAIQADPDRDPWDELVIEDCDLSTGPLPAARGAWLAGQVPGENAFDSKASAASPLAQSFVIRDTRCHGFSSGWIGNQAALNIKDAVQGVVERCVVFDNVIAFRLRGPASPVTVRNCVVTDNQIGVRYEDGITDLTLLHNTFAANGTHFRDGGGGGLGARFTARNNLFEGAAPAEVSGFGSNMGIATADLAATFAGAGARDYRLRAGAAPVDAGVAGLGVVDDHDGRARPQGGGFDVGAFER